MKISAKKAIIIGAGIAGPAMAMRLQEIGIEADIYEARHEDEMKQGVFLGLTPNGLNMLRDFIDLKALKEEYTPGKMCFYNARGENIGELDTADQLEKYGTETIQIRRSLVSELLRGKAVKRGIRVYYEKKLQGLRQENGTVSVEFEDGSTAEADLLIACDGTFSAVRNILFPDAPKPVYTKMLSTGAFVSKNGMEKFFGAIRMFFGHRAFFAYAVSNRGETWWFNNFYREKEPDREELGTTLPLEIKTQLLEIHKNDPEPIPAIIAATKDVFVYPVYDIPLLPHWHKGNICLIGDAAHATAPHIGQGASMALEDTKVLAASIQGSTSLPEAFERFQGLRKPRVEKLVKAARKVGDAKSKPNPLATFFRDLFLKHFIKFEKKRTDWIYSYRADEADSFS